VLRVVTWLIKIISRIFLLILTPFKIVGHKLFKTFLLPIYNLLHLLKKQAKNSLNNQIGNKITVILTNQYLIYFIGFVIFLSVLANNILIKNAAAEDLAKKSIFYQIVAGDNFEEEIEDYLITQRTPQNGTNSSSDIFVTKEQFMAKNSVLEQDKTWLPTDETQNNGNLALNALIKNSPVQTISGYETRDKIVEYNIVPGDTLYSIAQKFNISLNTVLWANKLTVNSTIKPDNKLLILPVSGVMHQIKKGDTLINIAKKYNAAVDKILAYNQIVSEEQLSIGDNLIIPGGEIKTIVAVQKNPSSLASNLRSKSNESNAEGFIWPTTSRRITQYFSWRQSGIDIGGAPVGSSIYAAKAGRVIKSGWATGYGNHIIIEHGNGAKTLYGHMIKLYVKAGEQVEQGFVIGSLGSTGWSTGPHLHFEIIINGKKINPLSQM